MPRIIQKVSEILLADKAVFETMSARYQEDVRKSTGKLQISVKDKTH